MASRPPSPPSPPEWEEPDASPGPDMFAAVADEPSPTTVSEPSEAPPLVSPEPPADPPALLASEAPADTRPTGSPVEPAGPPRPPPLAGQAPFPPPGALASPGLSPPVKDAPLPHQQPWLPISLALGCVGVVGEYLLVVLAWNARCPADSFVKDGMASLPLVVIAGASQFVFWFCLGHYLTGRYSGQPLAFRRRWLIATLAALVVNLLTLPILAFTVSCVSPSGIVIQNNVLGGARRYAWTDVAKIESVCAPSPTGTLGGWKVQYFLRMKDGGLIPLGRAGAENEGLHFAQIVPALNGRQIPIDTSGVAAGCPPVETTPVNAAPAPRTPPHLAAHHRHVRHARACFRVLTDPSQNQC